jgi:transketolase
MRDRLILSIGHVAPVYYAALAHSGYFPKEELLSLRKLGSRLQGHPGRDHGLPGLELSAGSLGQGLSVAVGMALAAKLDGMKWKVVCIMGDGEMQEGSIWEAGMSAAHHQLGNLIGIIDRNYCQIDGPTRDVMDIEPLQEKWTSFGWHVHSCDGNDFASIISTWNRITSDESTQPHMIIARTAMGKGVSDIENDYRWHGKAPNQEQANHFIRQIIENHEQSL